MEQLSLEEAPTGEHQGNTDQSLRAAQIQPALLQLKFKLLKAPSIYTLKAEN